MTYSLILYYKNDTQDCIDGLTLHEARDIVASFATYDSIDRKYTSKTRRTVEREAYNQLSEIDIQTKSVSLSRVAIIKLETKVQV